MTNSEYIDWLEKNIPQDMDHEDFVNGLAIGTIKLLIHISQEKNMPISHLIESMADNFVLQ